MEKDQKSEIWSHSFAYRRDTGQIWIRVMCQSVEILNFDIQQWNSDIFNGEYKCPSYQKERWRRNSIRREKFQLQWRMEVRKNKH